MELVYYTSFKSFLNSIMCSSCIGSISCAPAARTCLNVASTGSELNFLVSTSLNSISVYKNITHLYILSAVNLSASAVSLVSPFSPCM